MKLADIVKASLEEQNLNEIKEKEEKVIQDNIEKEALKTTTLVEGSDGKPINSYIDAYVKGSQEVYKLGKDIEEGKDEVIEKEEENKPLVNIIKSPLNNEPKEEIKEEVKPKIEIIVNKESTKVVETIVSAAQDKKAFNEFRKKRAAAMRKATMPLPMSNTFIIGNPIHSNAILNAMKPIGENDTEYDRLTRCLNIISDLVEIRGVGRVDQLELSKLVSYLELSIVFFTIYMASTNGTTTLDIPCANPKCPSFAKPFQFTIDNMDIMHVEKPELYKEYVSAIKNEKNVIKMMTESDTNTIKHLTLSSGNIVLIKIPSLFDYMQKTLVNINDNNRIFSEILALCPFIQEIRLLDEDKYIALTTFEEIFEELVRYTEDDDLEKINLLIEETVVNKMVQFRLPKEKLVCPHCKQAYPQDIPMEPEQMLFQIPAMRKIEKK